LMALDHRFFVRAWRASVKVDLALLKHEIRWAPHCVLVKRVMYAVIATQMTTCSSSGGRAVMVIAGQRRGVWLMCLWLSCRKLFHPPPPAATHDVSDGCAAQAPTKLGWARGQDTVPAC
jgi:hypothetical protein